MMNDARATSAGSSPTRVASCSSAAASPRWMKIHCTSTSGSLSSARTNAQFRRASKRDRRHRGGRAHARRAAATSASPARRARSAASHRPAARTAVAIDAVEKHVDVAPALVRLVLAPNRRRPGATGRRWPRRRRDRCARPRALRARRRRPAPRCRSSRGASATGPEPCNRHRRTAAAIGCRSVPSACVPIDALAEIERERPGAPAGRRPRATDSSVTAA